MFRLGEAMLVKLKCLTQNMKLVENFNWKGFTVELLNKYLHILIYVYVY